MKILFSPSETKSIESCSPKIDKNSFIFKELFDKRVEVLKSYQNFVDNASSEELKKLFGIKKDDMLSELKNINVFKDETTKAIIRYTGVAYKHLDYGSLKKAEQNFIDENVIIFSNIFGAIKASDKIPFYKLKQGEKVGDLVIEKEYKRDFSTKIDEFLKDEFIIDLRAGFYKKFYTLKQNYTTLKFMKNGKIVSHFAKAYRGSVLRELSIYQPKNEKEFENINFKGVRLKEILERKFEREYVFDLD